MEKKPTLDPKAELMVGVGTCLDAWSSVELETANLYMIMNGVKRDEYTHPIRSAYESVISLEARLAMVLAYAQADQTLSTDYFPHLDKLTNRIRKLYKKRHEAAHFKLVMRRQNSQDKYYIRPYFTWNDFVSNDGPELSIIQLVERAQIFFDLVLRIQRHIQHVGALRKLPPEHYVQAGDQAFRPLGPEDLSP